ncbi:MAG: RHS repeat-associated core domain-containing protein [Anaerolineaceae bacterium]
MTANEDGTWNSTIQYTAFGEIRASSGLTATKYRYTGQLAQDVLGLDYYVARWMDPLTGHFISADSVIPDPRKSTSYDRFSYVRNNPINYIDPLGHVWQCVGQNQDHCSDDGLGERSGMVDSRFDEIYVNIWNGPDNEYPGTTGASEEIIDTIRKWEGDPPPQNPYNDSELNCTVGWGHKLHDGGCSIKESGTTYPLDELETFFELDIAVAEKMVRKIFQEIDIANRDGLPNGNPYPITQAQFDALVDYTFNAGVGELITLINGITIFQNETPAFDYREFSNIMVGKYLNPNYDSLKDNSPGVKDRRFAENKLFLLGIYP